MSRTRVGLGASGPDVELAQRLLGVAAEQGASPGPTGRFDVATLAAVVSFQLQHGLPASGVVDDRVWEVLTAGVAGGSHDEVYEHAAAALAEGRVPTFAGLSGEQVARAFLAAFPGLNPAPAWLEEFTDRVHRLSGGTSSLREGDPAEFEFRPKGPAALLVLERPGEQRRVVIMPAAQPIVFDE
ncbi:peptidoglycan-binding domain-containing protein [Blastococcus tunisiensis]|uniref:Putative peptidoglycan binding domain-containing protein n=1 Tax=Blastococcus tunisiensis TaxID=1798228 RepID=A0A1I2DPR9_9ACTN|nr:peptidoglycan-binding domain-containing protein [Blastococcus sp. DSM 46838]SFE82429.1 Putative peptidoglycan binding domain-containing protein [Blastococcus sp. DSM 46838]